MVVVWGGVVALSRLITRGADHRYQRVGPAALTGVETGGAALTQGGADRDGSGGELRLLHVSG